MKLHELKPAAGSKKAPKRVGRGTGSGLGRNAGKGEKGQKARSGGGVTTVPFSNMFNLSTLIETIFLAKILVNPLLGSLLYNGI